MATLAHSKLDRLELTARIIHDRFRDSAEAMTNRTETRRQAYRRMDPSYVPENVGAIRVKSPYLWAIKNVKLSWIMRSLKANGDWIQALPYAEEYITEAEVTTQAVNFEIDKSEEKIEYAVDGALKYGDQYCVMRHYERPDDAGVEQVNLNINDVYPDPYEQLWYVLRRFITMSELRDMAFAHSQRMTEKDENGNDIYEEGEVVFAVDEKGKPVYRDGGVALRAYEKVMKAIVSDERPFDERYGWAWSQHKNTWPAEFERIAGSDDFRLARTTKAQDDPMNARISLLEYHETRTGGRIAMIIADNPSGASGEDIFFMEPTKNPYGICQVQHLSPWPVDEEAWGYGIPEIAGGLSDLKDLALRASARRILRFADPAILHRRRSKIAPVYLKTQSNVAIGVREMDDLKYMDPPAGGDMHQLLGIITRDEMDMGLGESEQRRGMTGGASSATEAAIAEQAGTTSDFLVFQRVQRWLKVKAELVKAILAVHMDRAEYYIPSLGRRTAEILRVTGDVLQRRYLFKVSGSPTGANPAARVQNLLQINDRMAQYGVIDPAPVAQYALTESGFNPARFMQVAPPMLSVTPQLEHQMLFDNLQRLTVSPKDDHAAHAREHGTEIELRRSGAIVTDPDLLEELFAHQNEHVQIMQQQMMAQMAQQAAGGQQGGASPMQPGDAGKPGQPAVFNARTQGMNQQRQAPNEGQAPQPMLAPGREGGVVNTAGRRS